MSRTQATGCRSKDRDSLPKGKREAAENYRKDNMAGFLSAEEEGHDQESSSAFSDGSFLHIHGVIMSMKSKKVE